MKSQGYQYVNYKLVGKLWSRDKLWFRAASMNSEIPKHASSSSSDGTANRNGGGIFIAIGTVGGAIVGGLMGQPSVGLLAGLALGAAAALLIWWRGR